jgi:hypothetical protein
LSEQEEIEIIDSLRKRYNKKLAEYVQIKITNDKEATQHVLELAELLEEIYTKSNQKFLINTICVEIARNYKTAGDPRWHWINDYLPEKYKNPKQVEAAKQRWEAVKAEIDIQPSYVGREIYYDNPTEDLSPDQIRDGIKHKQKELEEWQRLAEDHGVSTVNYSSQDAGWNSSFAKKWNKTSTVEPPKWTDEEAKQWMRDSVHELTDALEEYIKDGERFWPQFKDQLWAWGNGFRLEAQLWRMLEDDKYSLHYGDWINKEMYRQIHGKHAAAVFEKALTVLCAECSKNVENEPDEYEVMFADAASPTKWRCKKCNGTESLLRAMTREQIGDRSDFVMQTAWECIKWGPAKLSAMLHYNVWKRPYNTSRKTLLYNELSELA